MIAVRATLAQLVERLIRNQQVASSILAGGSKESLIYILIGALRSRFGDNAGSNWLSRGTDE